MARVYQKDHKRVPVFKNMVFGLKLGWEADKRLLIGYLINMTADKVFSLYVQSILFLKTLLGIIDSEGSFEEYAKSLVLFLAVSIFLKAVNWYSNYLRQVAVKNVLKKLNNKIFQKAVSLDIACYEDPAFYDKYQRATDVLAWSLFDAACSSAAGIIASVIALCLVIGTVTVVDPKYLVLLLPSALVFVVEMLKSRVVYKRDKEMTTNNRIKAYIQRTVFLKDFSKDMRTSNIFSVLMYRFRDAIDSNVEILRAYGLKLFLFSAVSTLFGEFIPVIGTYALAAYQFVFAKTLTVSAFSVVLSSINSVKDATLTIAQNFESMSRFAYYFQNMLEFLDFESSVADGTKECEGFESLEFRNVTFKYPSAQKETLQNVSFKINKGETLALIGVNGAGKSTLVKLLLRFYDVTDGEIILNGINIKEYKLDSLRRIFGAVFQDYRNFAITVNENLMCHECDEEDKKKAEIALKQSGVWEKVSSLPEKGDTVLTREFEKDGAGLSGGENQKLSVARLFAKDFSFAVLDEPSSALDPIAEYKMYESLINVTKGKTVLYISHRLSSAVLSDRIIVLDGGTIAEEGSHAELMKKGGVYSEMFTLQASSYNKEEVSDSEE
ncbi:MAG: ABC transporter ATP-binding protein [Clostridia bacterium]|nr:ABC transporter ATP-binding protein [Clostridia bacterium]